MNRDELIQKALSRVKQASGKLYKNFTDNEGTFQQGRLMPARNFVRSQPVQQAYNQVSSIPLVGQFARKPVQFAQATARFADPRQTRNALSSQGISRYSDAVRQGVDTAATFYGGAKMAVAPIKQTAMAVAANAGFGAGINSLLAEKGQKMRAAIEGAKSGMDFAPYSGILGKTNMARTAITKSAISGIDNPLVKFGAKRGADMASNVVEGMGLNTIQGRNPFDLQGILIDSVAGGVIPTGMKVKGASAEPTSRGKANYLPNSERYVSTPGRFEMTVLDKNRNVVRRYEYDSDLMAKAQIDKIKGTLGDGQMLTPIRDITPENFNPSTFGEGIQMGIVDSAKNNDAQSARVTIQGPKGSRMMVGPQPAPEVKPKTKLLDEISSIEKRINQSVFEQRQEVAAKTSMLESLSSDDIHSIESVRRMAASKAGQEGDIETLYKRNGPLVSKVLERMREITRDYDNGTNRSDEELLDMALNLPKKSELRVYRDKADVFKLKELKEQAKNTADMVYNGQATPETLDKIMVRKQKALELSAKQEYNEWQKSLNEFYDLRKYGVDDVVAKIKTNTTSPLAKEPQTLKDISGFDVHFNTLSRNLKKVYGPRYEQVQRLVLNPFNNSKGKFIKEQEVHIDELNKNIVKKFGFKKGSPESQAIQLLGEGKMTQSELVDQFGNKKAAQIIESDRWFRGEYDRLLSEVNSVRSRIYPGQEDKIIPRRSDYYRHFMEVAQGMEGLKNIFMTPSNIDSKLAGISYKTKPKTKWLSFAQKRLTDDTTVDAIGGYLDYIKAAEYAKHIDPHTASFRNLAREMSLQTERGEGNTAALNNAILLLERTADDLAGKTNPWDRVIQESMPGGRKSMAFVNWLNSRIKSNVILGNASSSIAQFFNIPQGMANVNNPKYWAEATTDTVQSMVKPTKAMSESTFLRERFFKGYDQFDTGILNNTKKFAAWMVTVGDEIGTKYVWNMHYKKALSEAIDSPVRYADEMTANLVAGRGIGEVPIVQKSKMFQLVAPFQLEVANQWWVMKDWMDEKKFGKFATFFIASYLMNAGAKQLRGSDVSFNPIQAVLEGYNAFQEEDDERIGMTRAAGRVAGEVVSNLPMGQTLAATYPEYGFKYNDMKMPTREKLFGDGDPTRFGSGLLIQKGIQDPMFKIAPPFGGAQLKKTLEGVGAVNKGYSESQSGRIQYPVENNLQNYAQSALYGKYATPEGQEYIRTNESTLGDKQSAQFKSLSPDAQKRYYEGKIRVRQTKRDVKKQVESLKADGEKSATEMGFMNELPFAGVIKNASNMLGLNEKKGRAEYDDVELIKELMSAKDPSLSNKEIRKYYLRDIDLTDNTNRYTKAIDEKKVWSRLGEVEKNDKLTANQKKGVVNGILKKIGISENDYEYYKIARESTDLKTLAVYDKIEKLGNDRKAVFEYLIKGRRDVNGQTLISKGVLDNMVEDGTITKEERKLIEKFSFKDGKPRVKVSGRGKKAKLKKISITVPKIRARYSGGGKLGQTLQSKGTSPIKMARLRVRPAQSTQQSTKLPQIYQTNPKL